MDTPELKTSKTAFGRFFKKNKYLLWAFLIPAGILFTLYAVWQVWPFGKHAVLVLDLNGQYVYFFEELRAMVYEGRSILYSFGRALGGEFMGIYAYYLASPLSYIVCLFPKKYMCEAIYLILVIKAGLCGSTMAYYLRKIKGTPNAQLFIFSSMYALCSYAIVQAHNTMWIDELFWLPLLVLGIEKLIREKKYKLYVISLAMSILSNFYIGYMMCIFTLLYFFYSYLSDRNNNPGGEKAHFIKTLLRTGLFTAIGVGISAVIILTAYYSLQFGKTTFSTADFSFSMRFDFLDLAAKFFANSYDSVRPEGLPFVYCGILTLIALPCYFMSGKIKAREKIFSGILILILIFSFMISPADIVWHGFQKPNWLNYRYSFMLCFLLVTLAYKGFDDIKSISNKTILGICSLYVLTLFVIQKQGYEYLKIDFVLVNLGLIAMYLILLYFYKKFDKKALAVTLLVCVCVELFANGILDIYYLDDDVVYGKRNAYVNYMEKYSPSVEFVKRYDDGKFFRMEKDDYKKKNDQLALGYYGLSNSTSTLNKSVITLLAQMGYASKSHWSVYTGCSPVSDSLLGIKYIIYSDKQDGYPYELINTDENYGLYTYKNPYALGLAYCVNENMLDFSINARTSPFEVLNSMVKEMLGSEEKVPLFKPISYETQTFGCTTAAVSGHYRYTKSSGSSDASVTYSFTVPEDGAVYFCIPTKYSRKATVKINGEDSGISITSEKFGIMNIGKYSAGDTVEFKIVLGEENFYASSSVNTYFYTFNEQAFENAFSKLAQDQYEIDSFSSTYITGKVNVPSDKKILFTSIPYDEGWIVTVDGKRTELSRTCDSLLAVKLSEGEHSVTFRYMPKCFITGMIISSVSLAVFIAIWIADETVKKKRTIKSSVRAEVPEDGETDIDSP